MNRESVRIRLADEHESPVLAALHLSTARYAYAGIFPADAPPPELSELIDDWAAGAGSSRPAAQQCFVAYAPDVIVGVVIAGPAQHDPALGHVSRFYVDPSHWGTGIGSLLHAHAITHLREHGFRTATLWVLEHNGRARRFYEHLGWQLTGDRLTTYAPGNVDDVEYQRSL